VATTVAVGLAFARSADYNEAEKSVAPWEVPDMGKDRIKPLFTVLETGDAVKFREAAEGAIREIEEDQRRLNRDIRFIRDLVERYGGAADGLTSHERSTKIRDAAFALAKLGKYTLTAQDVVDYIRETEGIKFDVKRPASVVGTVLARLEEFQRLEMNQFRFKEMPASTTDAE
jgi:hypothetical protein